MPEAKKKATDQYKPKTTRNVDDNSVQASDATMDDNALLIMQEQEHSADGPGANGIKTKPKYTKFMCKALALAKSADVMTGYADLAAEEAKDFANRRAEWLYKDQVNGAKVLTMHEKAAVAANKDIHRRKASRQVPQHRQQAQKAATEHTLQAYNSNQNHGPPLSALARRRQRQRNSKAIKEQCRQRARATEYRPFIGLLMPASEQTDEKARFIAAACAKGFQGLNDDKECMYITELLAEELWVFNFILFDPGCRDLFHGIHETSEPSNPKVHRLTSNQRNKETRLKRHRSILNKVKSKNIYDAEDSLETHKGNSMHPAKFTECLEVRAKSTPTLSNFYGSTMTTHTTSSHSIHAKYVTTADPSWCKRKQRKMAPYVGHTARDYPLHRKLRLSAYANRQQSDARFVRKLRRRFGKNVALIIGNWSAGMVHYHKLICSKGWRKTLQRLGVPVFLIDEYNTQEPAAKQAEKHKARTDSAPGNDGNDGNDGSNGSNSNDTSNDTSNGSSSINGNGNGNDVGSISENSETAGDAKKSQPKQHKYREYVLCHGLLRCTNKDCLKTTPGYEDTQHRRLWNRDMAAVLNFRKILMAHRMGKERPKHLRRPQSKDKASDTAASKPKRTRKKAAAAPRKPSTKKAVAGSSTSDSVASKARPRKRARVSSVSAPSIAVSVNIDDDDDASDDAQLLLQRLLLNN
ncbi:hypothetical protein H4R99_001457 [Coemansia sp. RSA 1722]|nr:hypothetical protein H4R99_001457 [Coemansia sp. RSA 1722]